MTWSANIDVAGATVAVSAPEEYVACIQGRLGKVEGTVDAQVEITVHQSPPDHPDRPPDQQIEGFDSWEEDGALWIGHDHSAVRIRDTEVVLGGPIDDERKEDLLDDLLQFGIAQALATPRRILIHGAVVASGEDALVVVGRSGQGKSTLAGAALVAGWDLLGDDLAMVHPNDSLVRAVQRPPMVPADIAAEGNLHGRKEPSPRGRIQLPVETLQPDTRRLLGVVSVAHGIDGGVELRDGAAIHTLDDALALPPFRSVIRRHLAAGAALVTKPTILLSHAEVPQRRLARAIESLEAALDLCRATDAQ